MAVKIAAFRAVLTSFYICCNFNFVGKFVVPQRIFAEVSPQAQPEVFVSVEPLET